MYVKLSLLDEICGDITHAVSSEHQRFDKVPFFM